MKPLAILLLLTGPVMADDDKPSIAFCLTAKAYRKAAGSDKAAEDAARAQGVSEATIAKAKRCK